MSVAEAAKAIGETREQLYNGINGGSAAAPEMAVRFAMRPAAAGGTWHRMQAAHDFANVRQSQQKITARGLARPA